MIQGATEMNRMESPENLFGTKKGGFMVSIQKTLVFKFELLILSIYLTPRKYIT